MLNDVKQNEIETAEVLVPTPSAFEVEMATGWKKSLLVKFQKKLLKQEMGKLVLESIHLLILFGIRRNCLRSGKESIIVPIDRKGDKTVYSAFLVILLISRNIGGGGGEREDGEDREDTPNRKYRKEPLLLKLLLYLL